MLHIYQLIMFDFSLRNEDEEAPLIGIRFIPNKKNKIFSLLAQEYDINWSERYKCYILPWGARFDFNILEKSLCIIDLILDKLDAKKDIPREILEREENQSYFTSPDLAQFLAGYINNTSTEKSILLDPAAGTGNLLEPINIPKDNIHLVEPNKEYVDILRAKGYKNVFHMKFEDYLKTSNIPSFTHIIMNPPFKNRMDLLFFNECFKLLEPGGIIAAVVSENSIYEELEPLGLSFDIDHPSMQGVNNFSGLSNLLQEFNDNLHNCSNCFMDPAGAFENTSAHAYWLLAEKRLSLTKKPEDDIKK